MDQYLETQSTLLPLLPHNVYHLLPSTLPSVPSHLSGSRTSMMISQGKRFHLSLSCSVFVSHSLFFPSSTPNIPPNMYLILKQDTNGFC